MDGQVEHPPLVEQRATVDPSKDPMSYLIAVGAFGLALLGFIIMAGVAVALGAQVPDKFWLLGTSIAGVLTGILVPPTQAQQDAQIKRDAQAPLKARAAQGNQEAIDRLRALEERDTPAKREAQVAWGSKFWTWAQRQDLRLMVLGGLFIVCGIVGLVLANTAHQGGAQLFAVAGATGAAALGILVPSPKIKP